MKLVTIILVEPPAVPPSTASGALDQASVPDTETGIRQPHAGPLICQYHNALVSAPASLERPDEAWVFSEVPGNAVTLAVAAPSAPLIL